MISPLEARRFAAACVASPHYLASAAGAAVLAGGGNAVDAAVATNLVLAVVAPYHCGFGGDCFALLWAGGLHAYVGSGRAPAAATPEAVAAAAEAAGAAVPALPLDDPRFAALVARDDGQAPPMPVTGPLPVTVPGVVDAWFVLLERFGTRSFGELARPALAYARDGFALTHRAAAAIAAGRARGGREWHAVYGQAAPGRLLRQPGLARTIETLANDGVDAYYRGPIGAAVAEHVAELGGLLDAADLAGHRGEWVAPLSVTYRGVEVVELPPPTQGVVALEALNIVEGLPAAAAEMPDRHHWLIEALKLALADRDTYLTDPAAMAVPASLLASRAFAHHRRSLSGAGGGVPPAGAGGGAGTAYLCAVDSDGMAVSLIQSNYMGFGSGVTVPDWGINLHNRGAYFSLDRRRANVIAPAKRTLHTLMPAMALREGRPWLVFGTMGGDGQAQTQLQVLTRLVDDGQDLVRAIAAPRWLLDPAGWTLLAESRFPPSLLQGLAERGHRVSTGGEWDERMGHAHGILCLADGLAGASDPRSEGLVTGF